MINLDISDDIWTVSLDRGDKANALNTEMLSKLCEITGDAHKARALILTAKGRVFSSGADLDEVHDGGLATSPLWEKLSGQIASLPCFTIAALNGTVAGGAIGMVLACDVRIASSHAKIFYPVMKLGVLPQPSDPVRMRALIGPARSKMLFMGGQKLTAQEAYAFGLFDRLCPAEALADVTAELTEHLRAATTDHAASIKALCGTTSAPAKTGTLN